MLPGALQGLLVLLTAVVSQAGSTQYHWDYVVVGAGPAGLQLGHFLQEAGRDYVILEKANVSGRTNFFDKAKKKKGCVHVTCLLPAGRIFDFFHPWMCF